MGAGRVMGAGLVALPERVVLPGLVTLPGVGGAVIGLVVLARLEAEVIPVVVALLEELTSFEEEAPEKRHRCGVQARSTCWPRKSRASAGVALYK